MNRKVKDTLLIVFARNPVLGKVKTRLAAGIGEKRALEVYKDFIHLVYEVSNALPFDKAVFFTEFPEKKWFPGYKRVLQSSRNLGESMKDSFRWAFEKKYKKVYLIGTDCPYLTKYLLEEVNKQLDTHDFVLGPAEDGGYYLIGMNDYTTEVFDNVEWSTSSVLQTTLGIIKSLGKTCHLLPKLNDIDTMEDWMRYEGEEREAVEKGERRVREG
ncbi:MAG: glycosyltransferase [Bacteroidetes bacterium]|nr:glycosyltransferase [Bacteroidota bacterium]